MKRDTRPKRRQALRWSPNVTPAATMNATSRRHQNALVISCAVVVIGLVAIAPMTANAAIPGVSATINEPTPNPTPAGSTASTSAQFSLAADTGPISVSIELQGPAGFGSLRLDAAGTTSELSGCVESATAVTCDWDGQSANSPQTLAVFIDVDETVPPNTGANLAAIVTAVTPPDTDTYANVGMFTSPPLGTTSLSGIVITEGGIPVENACIFVLSSPLFVFPAIADSAGNWAVNDLPDTYTYAIGVVPPFIGTFGPCANNGPPPIPGPGELQPVFYDNIWIDLSDPALTGGQGDPYVFAVNAGATVFSSSASGLESCLSTAPPEAIPRPPCIAAVSTTTTTTTMASTTTTESSGVGAGGATTTTAAALDTLPLTGATSPTGWLAIGSVLLLLGAATLFAVRRSPNSGRHRKGGS